MSLDDAARRTFVRTAALAGAGLLVPAARAVDGPGGHTDAINSGQKLDLRDIPPANATEELMREHGILRRVLLTYRICARRLRDGKASGLAKPLNGAATLFRQFGEDFHERPIEEQYVFPRVSTLPSPVSRYPAILTEQHKRGRVITDFVLDATHTGDIPSGSVRELARALEAVDMMYEEHAAREDTVVYQAWKDSLSAAGFNEMTQKFEDIGARLVGHDGFQAAEIHISRIEEAIGAADIGQFTAPLIRG